MLRNIGAEMGVNTGTEDDAVGQLDDDAPDIFEDDTRRGVAAGSSE